MIKKSLFNKDYQKLLASQNAKERVSDVNNLTSLSILISSNNYALEKLNETIEFFRSKGLKAYGYTVVQNIDPEEKSKIEQLSRKHCSWSGVPQQSLLIQWLARKTDLLIALNPDKDPLLKYLTACSNSKLKTSLDFGGNKDVSIDIYVNDPRVLSAGIKKQCQAIYKTLESIGVHPSVII